MGRKYCSIPACINNRGTSDPNIHLYRLPPLNDIELRSKWMQAIKDTYNIDFKTSTALICTLHFVTEDFNASNKLKPGAIPCTKVKQKSSISLTIKVEPTETFEGCSFQYVNVDNIREQAKITRVNKNVPERQSPPLPQSRPGYCVKCIQYDVQVQKSNMENKRIKEKYEILVKENRRLKAHIKYLSERNTAPVQQVKMMRCQICSIELKPDEKHLCMKVESVACEYCSTSFKTTIELCEHLEAAKHNETLYECEKCLMVFSTASLLTFHRESKLAHPETVPALNVSQNPIQTINLDMDTPLTDKIYACAMCNLSFAHGIELRIHMRGTHLNRMVHLEHKPIPIEITKNRFECYICKIECISMFNVRRHLKLHVAARDKKCEICNENLTSNEIQSHICFSEKTIVCDYCGGTFNTTVALLQHLENVHDDRTLYKCRKCTRFFGMTQLRDWHEKQHNDKTKEFTCRTCKKCFAEKHLLKAHLTTHDKQINFLCPECGKGFKTAHSMKTHTLVHSEKNINCPDCPAVFNNPQIFNNHRALHMNLKYKCDECDATFPSRLYLSHHQKRKHKVSLNPKKFQCTQCPLKFDKLSKLDMHMRKHTGEKPFICEYCDKRYAYKQDLMKHMTTHVGNNIYQCDLCDKGFRLLYDLRRHSYTHYNGEKSKMAANLCE